MLRSLLIDFNSYFASVEQQLEPRLRGRPVGVVPVMANSSCCIASSYEAKAWGVKTGTGVAEARRLCSGIVLRVADHSKYVRMHHRAVAVVDALAPVRQVLSIDEMECELTREHRTPAAAAVLAQRIKTAILQELGECMRTSVGIAPNTLLAKLASNMQKPDGLTVLTLSDLPDRLLGLPIGAINGIGRSMEKRLHACGIDSMAALYAAPRDLLITAWGGVAGSDMYDKLRGHGSAPRGTPTRSMGHSHVLPPDLRHAQGAFDVLNRLTQKVAMRLRAQGFYASSLSVHVRCSRSHPHQAGSHDRWAVLGQTQDTPFLLHALHTLWHDGLNRLSHPVSVGVQAHGLVPAAQHTPDLFADLATGPSRLPQAHKRDQLLRTVDLVNRKHGKNALVFASALPGRDHAPMRIAFNRIPDVDSEA